MAIKRRTDVQQTKKHNLRHPLLKQGSTTLMLYNYIKQHPGCTWTELKQMHSSHQPITNMLNEGLIRIRGKRGRSPTYEVIPENSTGQGRDLVEVEIILFVNDYGEYSIRARMLGQRLTAHEDNPKELLRQKVRIRPARPDEPYASRPMIDINDLQISATPQEADPIAPARPLTIDGDYTIIPPD